MNSQTVLEVVNNLIGAIKPTCSHGADTQRLENLKMLTEVVDNLVFRIVELTREKDRVEDSVNKIGKFADKFIRELHEQLDEHLGEKNNSEMKNKPLCFGNFNEKDERECGKCVDKKECKKKTDEQNIRYTIKKHKCNFKSDGGPCTICHKTLAESFNERMYKR